MKPGTPQAAAVAALGVIHPAVGHGAEGDPEEAPQRTLEPGADRRELRRAGEETA